MNLNRYFVFFVSFKHLFISVILGLFVLLAFVFLNVYFGLVALLLFLGGGVYLYKTREHAKGEFELYMEKIYTDIGMTSKSAMLMLSVPMTLIDVDGHIIWKNQFFEDLFVEKAEEKACIGDLLKQIGSDDPVAHGYEVEKDFLIRNRFYTAKGKLLQKFRGKENRVVLVYFFDHTEFYLLKKKNQDEKLIVAVAVIDNYDEMMKSMEDSQKPQILAQIDAILVKWFGLTGGVLKKYERDKYILLFEHQFLTEMEEKKFEILGWVKEINHGNKIPVTLSIGISNSKESFHNRFVEALASLEIALGRGGDQVVLKQEEKIKFFGGKSQELEKRTKVKVRVIGNALLELMKQANQILIMGHTHCDIDCLGSAVGVYKIASAVQKNAHIILSVSNSTIDPFIQKISAVDQYDGVFINKNQAFDFMTKKTLLIVVDTHRPNFTEAPELLKMTENIIVLDHHRRGVDFIEDAVLTYHEPYASSTCELITEIIQYTEASLKEHQVKLTPLEAELLYSGVVVDTKGFIFKTGVRTFEAASYLRDKGVDTIEVKRMLQNDLESYVNISNIVKDVQILYQNIAVSFCDIDIKDSALTGAQAADQILGISGVEASFVLIKNASNVFISGRSLGRVNVQVILEKMGGGGHQTVAGAQLSNVTVEEGVEKLKEAIQVYLSEMAV
jgi:cyclic-di-AMP phosphodiesterase